MEKYKTNIIGHEHPDYILNNVKYSSVTQILNVINKPFLVQWANKLGLEGTKTEDVTQPAMLSGSLCHILIEKYGKNIDFEDGVNFLNSIYPSENKTESDIKFNAINSWLNFEKFTEDYKFEFVEQEMAYISDNLGYAGTIDAIIERPNGEKWLIDWKTGNSVYPEYFLQLIAYKQLYEEKHPFIKISGIGIVKIHNKGDYEFKLSEGTHLESIEPDFLKVFNACHEIYHWQRNYKTI